MQVPFSWNDGGQDVSNGSSVNMEESLRTTSGDDSREEHHKDGGDVLNCGVSDKHNLDNSTSRVNEVRGGDTKALTYGNVSGTGSTYGATMEMTSERGMESPNAPSRETIDAAWKAVRACRETGNIGLDDDENGESTNGRQKYGSDERDDTLTGTIDNEEVDVNDGEKDGKKKEPTKGNPDHPLGGTTLVTCVSPETENTDLVEQYLPWLDVGTRRTTHDQPMKGVRMKH